MNAEAACEALETALREISAAALLATCGRCWAFPGMPCDTPYPGGTHASRYGRALRRGLISTADLRIVTDALVVFTGAAILYPAEAAAPVTEPGAGWTIRERWLAGVPPVGDEEKGRYREYECELAGATA